MHLITYQEIHCFSFVLFLIVLVIPLINKPKSTRHLNIFIIFSIFTFEIINVELPTPIMLLWAPASAADADAVNPDNIKTVLAYDWSAFFQW